MSGPVGEMRKLPTLNGRQVAPLAYLFAFQSTIHLHFARALT